MIQTSKLTHNSSFNAGDLISLLSCYRPYTHTHTHTVECSEVCDWELVVCWWSLWSITPVLSPPPSRSLLLSHISFPPSVLSISVSPSPTLQMLNSVKSPVYPINRSITDVSIHFKIFFKHCIINVKDIWNHCEPTEKGSSILETFC